MKWKLLVLPLFLGGCFFSHVEPSYFYGTDYYGEKNVVVAEKTSLNVLWELGEAHVSMHSLMIRKEFEGDSIINAIEQPHYDDKSSHRVFCPKIHGSKVGERILENSVDENLDAECFYFQKSKGRLRFDELESIVSLFFNRNNVVIFNQDNKFKLVYCGDSLQVLQGSFAKHGKIGMDTFEAYKRNSFKSVHLEVFECRESLYEIVFDKKKPILSLIIDSGPHERGGYKPLRIDSSILPLESPGYKKLREQEASLRIGK